MAHDKRVNELGISVLYEPSSQAILADVVFVHGLQGHPEKTWATTNTSTTSDQHGNRKSKTSKLRRIFRKSQNAEDTSANPSVHYWPAELLPLDHGNVRVLTYGYDSHISRFFQGATNKDNISQHGRALLNAVNRCRSSCTSRPLVFVAHSLGGIIVKEALIEGQKQGVYDPAKDVSRHCPAIVFFGTPHRGSNAASWGLMLSRIAQAVMFDTNTAILTDLNPSSGSSKLEDIERDFNPFLKHMKIYTFQESVAVTGFGPLSNKVVLGQSSAYNNREFEYLDTIHANHMNMCRFQDADDDGYQKFDEALTSILEHIVSSPSGQAMGEESQLNVSDQFRQEEAARIREETLERLNFTERLTRERQIKRAESSTTNWLWMIAHGSNSSFANWLSNDRPLFWIAGKPGSGKSTLMNMLCRDDQTSRLLNVASRESWEIVRFFFDFRAGQDIPNNLEGVFRSINFQLLRDGNATGHEQSPDMDRFDKRKNDQWSEEELKQAFLRRIRERTANIMIFVDGLDECEGDTLGLLQTLKNLPSAEKDPSLIVKVCVASRPMPLFQQVLKGFPRLQMENQNFGGIEEYASIVMRSLNPSAAEVDWRERIPRLIAERAEGVFLWAVFAVKEMARSYVEGERPEALEETLNGLPSDLGDLYDRTLSRLDMEKQKTAAAMFQLLSFATRDLRPEELIMASDILNEIPQNYNQRLDGNLKSALRRRISAASGGLLEVVSCEHFVAIEKEEWVVERGLALSDQQQEQGHSDAEPRRQSSSRDSSSDPKSEDDNDFSEPEIVRVIHQTVDTYLERSEFLKRKGHLHADNPSPSACWFQVCCKHLQDVLKDNHQICESSARAKLVIPGLPDLENQYWLVQYASTYVFEYALIVQIDLDFSPYPLMKGLINHGLTYLHDSCVQCENGLRKGADDDPWLLPILHSLHLFCRDAFGDGHYASHTGHNYLFYATVAGSDIHDDILERERNRVYDLFLGDECRFGTDSVIYSLQECSASTLSNILNSPFYERLIVRSGDGTEYRPLYFLVHNKRRPGVDLVDKIKILLEKGEDLNAMCGPAGTVLHTVIKGELCGFSIPLIKALLDLGADTNVRGPLGTPLQLASSRAQMGLLGTKESQILFRLARLLLNSHRLPVQTDEDDVLQDQLLVWMDSSYVFPPLNHNTQDDRDNSFHTSTAAKTETPGADLTQKMTTYAWIKRCLAELNSSTPFLRNGSIQTTTNTKSTCYGPHDPQARLDFKEIYDKVAEFRFCETTGDLSVQLYVQKSQSHVKIVCVSPRAKELNWATLCFDDLETAFIFSNTLSVLLGHDATVQGPWRYRHLTKYSREIFAGVIVHNGFRHALRVYFECKSFVRFEACIWSGDNRRSPIWTAFLAPNDEFSHWTIEALDGPFVKLNNIRRHYFADLYLGSKLEEVGDVVQFGTVRGK
ncbi:MAG: hypothetical protein Q9160_000709 [Pyrenula sp. 1 TL-2023]